MSVDSGGIDLDSLRFHLFSRPIHPEWFTLRAVKRMVFTGWESDVWIVPGGHVVHWRSGGIVLCEVVCSADLQLPEQGLIYRAAMGQERTAELRPDSRTHYQACFSLEQVDRHLFTRLSSELELEGSSSSLLYRHATGNRLEPSALAVVHLDPRMQMLAYQGFHTYPGVAGIVRTQTLIEIDGRES